mgnify:FL=1|tara:strand:- start:9 stop:1652 length:1644 start_codon:yes stop_codon:yes gene_type:complete
MIFQSFFLTALLVQSTFSSKSRSVSVSLSADWPTISLSPILEASEFFAEASQASFWEFTKRITNSQKSQSNENKLDTTDKALAHTLITARTMAPPLYHTVLEVSLDTRAFAPAVEFQRQLAIAADRAISHACHTQFDSGEAWAVVMWPDAPTQPIAACTPASLDINRRPTPISYEKNSQDDNQDDDEDDQEPKAKEKTKDTTPSTPIQPAVAMNKHDHIYPSRPLSKDIPIVYLFALIGTSSYSKYHQKLQRLANQGNIIYILRHSPTTSLSTDVTYLRGFGVTLDLKSMEYKALDDQVLDGEDGEDNEDDDDNENNEETLSEEEEELNGIYFKKLKKRYPSLSSSLNELSEQFELEAKEGSDGEMKVWDMKQLGLQATSRIIAAKDPLKQLSEISSNFPMYAKRLVAVPVEKKMIRQIDNVRQRVLRARDSNAGKNTMLLNGKKINADSDGFNIFELLTTILSEATTNSRFQQLGLKSDLLKKVMGVAANGNNKKFGSDLGELIGLRIDTRTKSKGCIYYMNNIEKDEHYKKWPKDLRSLMQPGKV